MSDRTAELTETPNTHTGTPHGTTTCRECGGPRDVAYRAVCRRCYARLNREAYYRNREARLARSDEAHQERIRLQADPTIIDASTGKPLARSVTSPGTRDPKMPRLQTLRDAARELAAVYRQVKRGDLTEEAGRSRAYVLRSLGDLIEVADLEQRITMLEQGRVLPTNGQELLPAPTNGSGEDDDVGESLNGRE